MNANQASQAAFQIFMKMNIRQVVSEEIVRRRNAAHRQQIALIGCGPASISCATFLARLGYTDVTIYEKEDFVGGLRCKFGKIENFCTPQLHFAIKSTVFLSASEIPQFRLPYNVVDFEIQLARDIGVKVWQLMGRFQGN